MFEFNPDLIDEGDEIDGDVCDSRLREKEEGDVSYHSLIWLSYDFTSKFNSILLKGVLFGLNLISC